MKILLLTSVCIITLIISGCGDTTTTQQKQVVCYTIEDGTSIRIMTINSLQRYWGNKQEEVVSTLDSIINSGEHNIISVKTFYSDAYLTSAELKYSVAEECDNRNLRIKFIHSPQLYWGNKQDEIKPALDSIVNGGTYDVFDVNTIMLKGYLVAAEVYYYEQ